MSNKNQIPPHLQAAFDTCRKILLDNDITGLIILHGETPEGPGVIMQTFKLEASYSCVEWSGKVLRVPELPPTRLVRHTDPPLFEHRDRTVLKTVNMLSNISMRLEENYEFFKSAELLVRSRFNVTPKIQGNGQQNPNQNANT